MDYKTVKSKIQLTAKHQSPQKAQIYVIALLLSLYLLSLPHNPLKVYILNLFTSTLPQSNLSHRVTVCACARRRSGALRRMARA